MGTETPTLDSVFCAAIEMPSAEERAAYVARACGGDVELKHRVEKLVAAHFRAGSFLERAAYGLGATAGFSAFPTAAFASATPPEAPGTRIGPYKLLKQLGEGGMGTVFLAEQAEPVQRQVALKLIKPGLDSRQVLARFGAERQALALMDHPNIARVLDGGATDSGRPYFVMELVQGVPITRYCDEHQLTLRQRLELFIAVCRAVQHAHTKGVIHRDLKPSNILVALCDGKPAPKVIDFGVAKATAAGPAAGAARTEYGSVVGTLEYMSPEQAQLDNLDIDTRSDVYALGVLLYELLTGTTPLQRKRLHGGALLEVLRIIREEEPPKPSTRLSTAEGLPHIAARRGLEPRRLSGLVRGELDWIVMKALEKDRTRRYETANGFALDVQRYLNDEPVQACPPSAWYRFGKFARRNKGKLTAAALVAAALLLGTGVSLWQALRADAEAANAVAEAANAEQQRREASQAVDEMYTQVAQKWLARQPGMKEMQRDFLLKALAFYEKFAQANRGKPKWHMETVKAYRRVASIQEHLGEVEKAEAAYQRAIALLERPPAGAVDSLNHRQALAESLQGLGLVFKTTGWPHKALEPLGRSRKLLEGLVKEFPAEPRYRDGLAATLGSLANVQEDLGRTTQANQLHEQAMSLLQELTRECPEVAGYRDSLALAQMNVATVLKGLGDMGRAEQMHRAAVAALTRLAAGPDAKPQYREHLAQCRTNLGLLLLQTDRHKQAEQELRAVVALYEKLVADFPGVPDYEQGLARNLSNWSIALVASARQDKDKKVEAAKALQRALELQEKLVAKFSALPDHRSDLARGRVNLGADLMEAGRPEEAEVQFREAITLHRKLTAEFPTRIRYRNELAHDLFALARCLEKTRPTAAEAQYLKTLDVYRKMAADFPDAPEPHASQARVKDKLARLRRKQDDRAGAAERMHEAVGHYRAGLAAKVLKPADQDALASALWHLAELANSQGRPEEAERLYREAIEIQRPLVAEFPGVAAYQGGLGGTLHNLAQHLVKRGEPGEARQLLNKAIEHQRLALQAQPLGKAWLEFLRNHHQELGGLLLKQGERESATAARAEAVAAGELLVEHFPETEAYHAGLRRDLFRLTDLLAQLKRYPEALQAKLKRIAVMESMIQAFPEQTAYRGALAQHCGNVADFLLNGPDPKLHDPAKALELAEKAAALDPGHKTIQHILGAAHYRNGNWDKAIAALKRSIRLTGDMDALNGFYLAMACFKLGREDDARHYLRLSVAWMARARMIPEPINDELRRLYAEAAQMIGL